jgi:hypothetical protein
VTPKNSFHSTIPAPSGRSSHFSHAMLTQDDKGRHLVVHLDAKRARGSPPSQVRRDAVCSSQTHLAAWAASALPKPLQLPPRAVLTPRAVRARAMPRMLLTPLVWISLMIGRTLAANASRCLLRASMDARRTEASRGAPSFLAARLSGGGRSLSSATSSRSRARPSRKIN